MHEHVEAAVFELREAEALADIEVEDLRALQHVRSQEPDVPGLRLSGPLVLDNVENEFVAVIETPAV